MHTRVPCYASVRQTRWWVVLFPMSSRDSVRTGSLKDQRPPIFIIDGHDAATRQNAAITCRPRRCAYEAQIQKMDADFRGDKCFLLDCGSEDAFKLLDKYAKDFEKELKTLEHNANLCAVFEFPEKIDVVRSPCFEV